MSRAIGWSAIKVAYVTSTKSYKGIAAEYGLPFASVAKKGRADGWPSLRKAFQEEAACRAIASGVDDEADRLANVMKAANAMGAALADVFSDADQFHRHLVQEYDGDSGRTVERVYSKVDTRAMKDLTGAIKDMTLVMRNLYNLPTQTEAEAQRIAAERLKLDQRKADAADSSDTRVVVEIRGFEEMDG